MWSFATRSDACGSAEREFRRAACTARAASREEACRVERRRVVREGAAGWRERRRKTRARRGVGEREKKERGEDGTIDGVWLLRILKRRD
jgi:hypothetical protein